jgi:fused signal recognition particle receptor
VEAFVKRQLRELLDAPAEGLRYQPAGPTVVMIAGVNGSGKTTSIAKLAHRCQQEGKRVLVAACDTFRAAAVEQLTIWSQRLGCDIVKAQPGADPASVAHDACEKAQARGFDVLIVDTAGRLHTQANLMRELEKIRRVVAKQVPGAPHEVLLVLDATTGQNAIAQAEAFSKLIQCTGVILAKLDGTAKGGAIFGIKQKLGLPVKFVGVGEKVDDLEPFDPEAFVTALFE